MFLFMYKNQNMHFSAYQTEVVFSSAPQSFCPATRRWHQPHSLQRTTDQPYRIGIYFYKLHYNSRILGNIRNTNNTQLQFNQIITV